MDTILADRAYDEVRTFIKDHIQDGWLPESFRLSNDRVVHFPSLLKTLATLTVY